MGIYDREYYRDETRGSGWFSGVAPACKTLILINVGVFLAQWVFPAFDWGGLLGASSTDIFRHGKVWELLTASFFHEQPFHILINMLVLWWFGREIESIYGTPEFIRMYLTASVLSTLLWAFVDYFGPEPGRGVMLGASGATTALFVLYATYYPRREVLVFFVLPMPIWLVCVIFIGWDFLSLTQQHRGVPTAAIAFAAHLGGAAYGFCYRYFDLRWSRLFQGRRFRPQMRIVRPEPPDRDVVTPLSPSSPSRSAAGVPISRPSPSVWSPPEQLDERLDEVLAKIAREGKSGLTEEENLILQEASRRARDRRSPRV